MLFVTLLSKTSTSLLYCNDCKKFLVDVERFVFYCDLLIVLIFIDLYDILINQEPWNVSWLPICNKHILINIYLFHSRLWDQQYFISAWHLSSWNVWPRRTFWNYSLHDNWYSIKILAKVCFGSSPRLVPCM